MEGVAGCGNVDKLDSHAVVLVGMEEKRERGDGHCRFRDHEICSWEMRRVAKLPDLIFRVGDSWEAFEVDDGSHWLLRRLERIKKARASWGKW